MRLLGIDYGTKKVGLAVTDPSGFFPTPYGVLPSDDFLVKKVSQLIADQGVERVVIGLPMDYKRGENDLTNRVRKFGDILAQHSGVSVVYHDETLTSKEAERLVGRDEKYDARAAALILKSYIDQHTK